MGQSGYQTASENTTRVRQYRSVIALHLKSAFEHIRLQRWRTIDIEAFLASKSTLAPATLEKIFTVLNSALKAAVRVRPRLLAENGAARSAAPWTVALDTGMRKSEIAGLLWSDVDFSQGRILV